MRAITSKEKLLKKLINNNLLFNGKTFYLSDFHNSKVGNVVAGKVILERIVKPTNALSHWFEKEWTLRKAVGKHRGVKIYRDDQRKQFFFKVKKGEYDIDTYEGCLQKIEYLAKLKEPLN